MSEFPRIYVDWNDGSRTHAELYLDQTIKDLKENSVEMKEGVKVRLFGDELECDAFLVFDGRHWIAEFVPGTMITVR
jgi:hypothetical protein